MSPYISFAIGVVTMTAVSIIMDIVVKHKKRKALKSYFKALAMYTFELGYYDVPTSALARLGGIVTVIGENTIFTADEMKTIFDEAEDWLNNESDFQPDGYDSDD